MIRRFFRKTLSGKQKIPESIREKLEDERTLEIYLPANLEAFHLLLLEALAGEAQREKGSRSAGDKVNRVLSIFY